MQAVTINLMRRMKARQRSQVVAAPFSSSMKFIVTKLDNKMHQTECDTRWPLSNIPAHHKRLNYAHMTTLIRNTNLISSLSPRMRMRTSCQKFILAISLFLLAQLVQSSKSHTMQMSHHLQQDPATTNVGQIFTCGKLYYRTFHLDQQRNVLYVGAM